MLVKSNFGFQIHRNWISTFWVKRGFLFFEIIFHENPFFLDLGFLKFKFSLLGFPHLDPWILLTLHDFHMSHVEKIQCKFISHEFSPYFLISRNHGKYNFYVYGFFLGFHISLNICKIKKLCLDKEVLENTLDSS